jgi:TolA-binding protein
MTVMAISALGFSASTFSVQAGYTASAEAVAEDEEQRVETAAGQKAPSGDISDNLSVSAKQLLKRLSELQAQLRELRSKMQAAENASYSNLAAKTSVVASFQSQISAITGTILLLSASLLKELDRSGGLNITA